MTGVDSGDTAWVLTSCALVLLMTPGLAFFYGGLVPGYNVLNTMMMSIISMGVVTVPWMLIGFSLAYAPGEFIGDLRYAGLVGLKDMQWPDTSLPALVFVTFQMTFAVIGSAIISGAIVERMRFGAFVLFILIWSLVVYVPICHWVWGPGGWIARLGGKDFAGGMVVHETTAVSALVLAMLLGPRTQRNHDKMQPHNVPFVILGTALLWFGWSGFNGGSALAADSNAALALINTYQAAGASLLTWTGIERWHRKSWSSIGSVTGAIVGLVVITPAAGFVTPIGAVCMGIIGAFVVYPSFLFNHHRVDDSLDAFPCHGVSGFVGTALTGLFAEEGGLFYGGGWRLLGAQFISASVTAAYAASVTALLFVLMWSVMRMRVSEETEVAGLDDKIHGEFAYAVSPRPSTAKTRSESDLSEDDSKHFTSASGEDV